MLTPLWTLPITLALIVSSSNGANRPINPRLLTNNVKVGEIPKPSRSLDLPQKFETPSQQPHSGRFGSYHDSYPANKFVVASDCTSEPRKHSMNCTVTRYQGEDFTHGQDHCDLKLDVPERSTIVPHDPKILDSNKAIFQYVEKTQDAAPPGDSEIRTTLHLVIVDFARCADTKRIDLPIEILSHRLLSLSQGQEFAQLFPFRDSFEVVLRNASGSSDQVLKLTYDYHGNPLGSPVLFPKFTALDLEHVLPVDEESPAAGYYVFAAGRLVQVGADGWAKATKAFHEPSKEFRDTVYSNANGVAGRCTSGDRTCLQFDARNLNVLANFTLPEFGEVQAAGGAKQRGLVPVAIKAMHNTRDGLVLAEAVRFTRDRQRPGDDLGYLLFRKIDREGRPVGRKHVVPLDYKFIDNDAESARRLRGKIYQTDDRHFQLLAVLVKKSSVEIAAEPESFL